MIVFYNPETGQITGMSYHPVQRKDPFIKTTDPVAEQIFQKKLNIFNYYVQPYPKAKNKGKIIEKKIITTWVKDSFFCIPKIKIRAPEFQLTQDLNKKIITVKIKKPLVESKIITVLACCPNDPFLTRWSVSLDLSIKQTKFNYQGSDQLSFYTDKIFKSYYHETRC